MLRHSPANDSLDLFSWTRQETDGEVQFTHPNPSDSHVWNAKGFLETNDHAANVMGWYGLRLVFAPGTVTSKLTVRLTCSLNRNPRPEALIDLEQTLLAAPGEVWVPLDGYRVDEGMSALAKAVIAVGLDGRAVDSLVSAELVAGRELLVVCETRGKAIEPGGMACYPLTLRNMSNHPLAVTATLKRKGTEVLGVELHEGAGERCNVEGIASHTAAAASHVEEAGTDLLAGDGLIVLEPHADINLTVSVTDNPRLGACGHETQRIAFATPDGPVQIVKLVTMRADDDFRTTIHQTDIERVKDMIATRDWAKEAWVDYRRQADEWQVPTVDPESDHLFETLNAEWAFNCAMVHLISGERIYGEKAAAFLKAFADPTNGYMRTLKAGSQELVHEGEFFRNLAATLDHMRHTDLIDEATIDGVEAGMRVFIDIIADECLKGKISNWNLAELVGAIFCAIEMDDLERVEAFIDMPGGLDDHIGRGILNDGWWYEASIGYNFLAIGLFLLASDALDRWGYDIAHRQVPASYADHYAIDEQYVAEEDRIDGLDTTIWGPTDKPVRSVEMLVNSMNDFFDYEGLIVGMNDATEMRAPAKQTPVNPRYDLAYRIYRTPALLPILATVPAGERDLYYGLPDLPTPDPDQPAAYERSASAPVAGLTLLRSKTPGRTPDQQYQLSVKTGILGGAHGHYDRLALNSIRRFGKSFYNPEMIWHSYHTFMYKFYVQNSVNHNMTTVDLKQQDPSEPKELLFQTGERMQASVFEVASRWCNPPYGGWVVTPGKTYAEQAWLEGRKVPLPAPGQPVPDYARRSDFTEPVTQRRATILTDDYILLVDYLEGRKDHQYDFLLHAPGLASLTLAPSARTEQPNELSYERNGEALAQPTEPVPSSAPSARGLSAQPTGGETEAETAEEDHPYPLSNDPSDSNHFAVSPALTYLGHTPTLDPSPLSSGQFITDCHHFAANNLSPVKASFAADMAALNDLGWFARQRTTANTPGIMHLDVWSVAPESREVVVGCDPEYYQTQQQLHYRVLADGTERTSGQFGAWIFGRDDIDLPLDGVRELTLETESGPYAWREGMIEPKPFDPVPALFWGNAYVETSSGERVALSDLPHADENVLPVPTPGRDYEGGPVKLEGKRMDTSLPASPADIARPAIVRVDLSGVDAVRLVASVGADNPIGSEHDRRRTLDFRVNGRTARFVTLIEQHDGTPVVRGVRQDGDDTVVELADGRIQRVRVSDPTLAHAEITLSEEPSGERK